MRTGEAPLRVQRADAVLAALQDVGAHRVVDMGCGPGALLSRLAKDRSFTKIVGVDVSARSLEQAERVLKVERASDAERERIDLLHGSVVYRDDRLRGYDAMVLMEVVEHVRTLASCRPRGCRLRGLQPCGGDRDHPERRLQHALSESHAWSVPS